MHRVSDGCLAARLRPDGKRPVRESNPSHLLDRQAGTPASSQGKQERLAGVEPTYPPWQGGAWTARPQAHLEHNSKGGRSRTLWPVLEAGCSPRSTPLNHSGRGGTRTCNRALRLPTAAQAGLEPATFPLTAGRSTIELQGNHSVRMAGFEPAFSSTPSWRIARLSYILKQTVPAAGIEPAAFAFSADALPSELHRNRSKTPAGVEPASKSGCSRPPGRPAPASSRIQSQRWDSNPLCPPYESGARPVEHRRHDSGWPVGVEPTHARFTAGSRSHFGFGHSIPGRSRT